MAIGTRSGAVKMYPLWLGGHGLVGDRAGIPGRQGDGGRQFTVATAAPYCISVSWLSLGNPAPLPCSRDSGLGGGTCWGWQVGLGALVEWTHTTCVNVRMRVFSEGGWGQCQAGHG